MLKIQGTPIKDLKYLLSINDFKGFCDEYEKNKECINNSIIPYEVANIKSSEIALPYVNFLLEKQKQFYSIVLLEYLLKNNFTNEVIDFLETIKEINLVVYTYDRKSAVNMLKSICKNKNMECLIYLVENSHSTLPEFRNKHFIFKEIVKNNFSEGVDYFSDKIENIHLYLLDDIIQKRTTNKESEINWDFYFYHIEIDKTSISKEQLKQSILDYAQSQYEINPHKTIIARMPQYSSSVIRGESSGIEPIKNIFADFCKDYFNNGLSKPTFYSLPTVKDNSFNYTNHKKDNVSQSIWLNEKLSNDLNIKNNSNNKLKKI